MVWCGVVVLCDSDSARFCCEQSRLHPSWCALRVCCAVFVGDVGDVRQVPNISVEDMAISAESLRQRASPPERLTLPLLQIKQDSEKVM